MTDCGATGDGADLDAWLAAQEARFADLRPGAAKRVIWADMPGARSDWAVVYIHGFSASADELRPLPDLLADSLDANLFLTRLRGHGRSGDAMAEASLAGWMADMREALDIGHRIGRRVLLVGCSTGATLIALALAAGLGRGVAGAVLISPNFRPAHPRARMLTWPGARWFVPLILGGTRGFEPLNDDHARIWTPRYPTRALLPMAQAVRRAADLRFEDMAQPAFFAFDPGDTVVDHAASRAVAARWGGGATVYTVATAPGDDPGRHVVAGSALSPAGTAPLLAGIMGWSVDLLTETGRGARQDRTE